MGGSGRKSGELFAVWFLKFDGQMLANELQSAPSRRLSATQLPGTKGSNTDFYLYVTKLSCRGRPLHLWERIYSPGPSSAKLLPMPTRTSQQCPLTSFR
jgi:hypothetical protein